MRYLTLVVVILTLKICDCANILNKDDREFQELVKEEAPDDNAHLLQDIVKDIVPQNALPPLGHTIFKDYPDYVAWTEYLCRQIEKIGDGNRLELIASQLEQMASKLSGGESIKVREMAKGYLESSKSLKIPDSEAPFDEHGENLFHLIRVGRYQDAHSEIIKELRHSDYINWSIPMKRILLLTSMIQYDGLNPQSVLPLWSAEWNLSIEEKIAIMIRANQFRIGWIHGLTDLRMYPAYRSFPMMRQAEARLLVNMGYDLSASSFYNNLHNNPLENEIIHAGVSLMKEEFCIAKDHLLKASNLTGNLQTKGELMKMARRLDPKCTNGDLEDAYKVICQVGVKGEYPLAASIVDKNPLLANSIAAHERMFSVRIVVGDCLGAYRNFTRLRNLLSPNSSLLHKAHINSQFIKMQRDYSNCQQVANLYDNASSQQIMGRLAIGDIEGARQLWWTYFGSRPRDPESLLWRKAILIARFPKLYYAPCVGSNILTGDYTQDEQLMDKLDLLLQNQQPFPCQPIGTLTADQCNLQWIKAFYVMGDTQRLVAHSRTVQCPTMRCGEVNQYLVCGSLCNSITPKQGGCAALEIYNKMSPKNRDEPFNRVGVYVASRLCHPIRSALLKSLEDSIYLRDGETIRPMSTIFSYYFKDFARQHYRRWRKHRNWGNWENSMSRTFSPTMQSMTFLPRRRMRVNAQTLPIMRPMTYLPRPIISYVPRPLSYRVMPTPIPIVARPSVNIVRTANSYYSGQMRPQFFWVRSAKRKAYSKTKQRHSLAKLLHRQKKYLGKRGRNKVRTKYHNQKGYRNKHGKLKTGKAKWRGVKLPKVKIPRLNWPKLKFKGPTGARKHRIGMKNYGKPHHHKGIKHFSPRLNLKKVSHPKLHHPSHRLHKQKHYDSKLPKQRYRHRRHRYRPHRRLYKNFKPTHHRQRSIVSPIKDPFYREFQKFLRHRRHARRRMNCNQCNYTIRGVGKLSGRGLKHLAAKARFRGPDECVRKMVHEIPFLRGYPPKKVWGSNKRSMQRLFSRMQREFERRVKIYGDQGVNDGYPLRYDYRWRPRSTLLPKYTPRRAYLGSTTRYFPGPFDYSDDYNYPNYNLYHDSANYYN